ncbi:MAG: extensin family protein [Pseudomonadota bacterium]
MRRRIGPLRRGIAALTSAVLAIGLVFASGTLPVGWNPFSPLALDEAPGPATRLKLRMLLATPGQCQALMEPVGNAAIPDRQESPQCHLRSGVRLTQLSRAALTAVETRCGIALRMWFWERDLQERAEDLLGSPIARIGHFSSYACRTIRTPRGPSTRMSQHATANAIDISGFTLADGRQISLLQDWSGDGPEAAFLRAAHRLGCRWFPLVLGPDYNRFHANHFHFDAGFWTGCR